jgi:hypothetical protein
MAASQLPARHSSSARWYRNCGIGALNAVRRGITQELGERPAGLVQAIAELEELSHDEACTQDVGLEFALHVPFQGDPAIEHLLIDPASEEELDEWIRLERFGHHPWFLQLLGQLQRRASVPFPMPRGLP